MKIFKHLRSDWFRYGFETLAVVVGILVAFTLDNWNEERKTKDVAEAYIEKIISDIVADTITINGLMEISSNMQKSIDTYFEFFNQGNIAISELIDSSKNVNGGYFRYLPVNYTFMDMQSSGNTILLTDEQRISLIELSNNQEFLQIIIEKVISQIQEEEHLRNTYLDFDRSGNDFFESISIQQDLSSRAQGLLHQHNMLSKNHYLAYQMISKGVTLKEKSKRCLEILSEHQK